MELINNYLLVPAPEHVALLQRYAGGREQELFIQVLAALSIMYCKLNNTDEVTVNIPVQQALLPVKLTIQSGDSLRDIILKTGNAVQVVYQNLPKIIHQLERTCRDEKPVDAVLFDKCMHSISLSADYKGMVFEINSNNGLEILVTDTGQLHSDAGLIRIGGYLAEIIGAFDNLRVAYRDIEYIPAAEKFQLLKTVNDTTNDLPLSGIIALFEDRVISNPARIALVDSTARLSYGTLYKEALKVATFLLSHYQLKKGEVVITVVERSCSSVINMMGILMAGGVYLPVSPDIPGSRLQHIQEESGSRVLLTTSFPDELLKDESRMDAVLPEQLPSDPAYIIYTSGSTGKPKGVPITHIGIINTIWDDIERHHVGPKDVCLQFFNLAFDGAVRDILLTLLTGATLYIPPVSVINDVPLLLEMIRQEGVTIASIIPSYIRVLNKADMASVRLLLSGGEAANMEDLLHYARYMTVVNMYGPSENAVISTKFIVDADKHYPDGIPIGKPIRNTQVYILDKDEALLPVGYNGEICIAGMGVTTGYIGGRLADAAFTHIPSLSNQLIYKTGDLGKWDEEGNITFTGRKDDQVKINGFRIELNEIKNVLLQYPGIKDAVCIAHQQKIYAFVEVEPDHSDSGPMLAYLHISLPAYMQVHKLILLDQLPLTAFGKVDKQKLLELIDKKVWIADISEASAEGKVLLDALRQVFGHWDVSLDGNFFEIGGDSLKAITLSACLSAEGYEVRVEQILETPVLKEIALLIKQADKAKDPEIPVLPGAAYYPVSHAQQRMWTMNQLLDEGSCVYHISDAWAVTGEVAVAVLEEAYAQLVGRHESLRTIFLHNENEIVQKVLPPENYEYAYISVADNAEEQIATEIRRPFELETGPLVRLRLYEKAANEYIVLLTGHHIVIDAWSCRLFYKELLEIYDAIINKRASRLPALSFQQKDYAGWHNRLVKGPEMKASREFWVNVFSKNILPTVLHYDLPGDIATAHTGKTISHVFSREQSTLIGKFLVHYDMTPYTFFTGLVHLLLFRYTKQERIVTGTPFSGRMNNGIENQIGFYVNMLPVYTEIDGGMTVSNYFKHVKENIAQVYQHQQFPVDMLIAEMNVPLSVSPLFNIAISWLDDGQQPDLLTAAGIEVKPYLVELEVSKYDLTFSFTRNEQYNLLVNYNTALFLPETITGITENLATLLDSILQQDQVCVDQLSLLAATEINLLKSFNTAAVSPAENFTSVIAAFEEKVLLIPDQLAVFQEGVSYSFAALNVAAGRIAQWLLQNGNIAARSSIGVMLKPGFQAVAAFAGILKAGCVYVPLDPDDPADRIRYITEDAGLQFIITQDVVFNNIDKPASLSDTIQPDHTAYIIYTSGTTGKPKGVKVSHGALASFCDFHNKVFNISQVHTSMLYSSLSFDAAVWENWPYLIAGAGLYVLPLSSRMDVTEIAEFLAVHRISHCFLPPVILDQLISRNEHVYLKEVILHTGGDKIRSNHLMKDYRVINNYGLTETTVIATSTLEPIQETQWPLTIGRPFGFAEIYILDERMALQPIGASGEICIAGPLLAEGYLHDEVLQREKFISSPFGAGVLFRTGDYGYWTRDGQIVFEGRKDSQVQLNGKRVELEEIRIVLSRFENVGQVVVYTKEISEHNPILAACYTANETIDPMVLKQYATSFLPVHMVPSFLVQVQEVPLTRNGKINYAALPDPFMQITNELTFAKENVYLIDIFKSALKTTSIDPATSFFDMGANSVLLINIHRQLKEKYPSLRVVDLFTHHNINQLSYFLDHHQQPYLLAGILPDPVFQSVESNSQLQSLQSLEELALKWSVSNEVLITGIFIYSLHLISTGDIIPLYIINRKSGVHALVSIDFNLVEDEQWLFLEVKRQIKDAAEIGPVPIAVTKATPDLLTCAVIFGAETMDTPFELVYNFASHRLEGKDGSMGILYQEAVCKQMNGLFSALQELLFA